MSHTKDCCPSCALEKPCEETPLCREVAVEPIVLPPTFRIDPESGRDAPAGEVTFGLWVPPHKPGYRCLVQSYGFNAPTLDPLTVGLYVPTFVHLAFVPRDTGRTPDNDNFAGGVINRQILENLVTGFVSFAAESGEGIPVPTDDSGRPWWVFLQIGSPLALPPVACGFNISFAAKRARWEFSTP